MQSAVHIYHLYPLIVRLWVRQCGVFVIIDTRARSRCGGTTSSVQIIRQAYDVIVIINTRVVSDCGTCTRSTSQRVDIGNTKVVSSEKSLTYYAIRHVPWTTYRSPSWIYTVLPICVWGLLGLLISKPISYKNCKESLKATEHQS